VISVCSLCHRVLGDKEPYSNTDPSHGFCLPCMAIWYAESGLKGNNLKSTMAEAANIKVSYRPVRLIEYREGQP
jgi:hypothetical protein